MASDVVGRVLLKRDEIVGTAYLGQQDALAIERQLDLVRVLEATHRAQVRPIEPDLKVVLAVERKCVPGAQSTDGAERQAFEMLVLRQILADRVGVAAQADTRIPDRNRADLPGRCEVRLQQRGRVALGVRHVVEPVGGFVRWQERGDIDVHAEQVTDRVRVFRAVQPAQDGTTRVQARRRRAVQLLFQPADQAVVGRLVRPFDALRGHHAQLQLPQDLFPGLRIGRNIREIERVQGEVARLQALVVTRHAVLIDGGLMR